MSCTSCSSNKTPGGCKSNGSCGTSGCGKLHVFDWLANLKQPDGQNSFNIVEVRFKNGRKDFFVNDTGLELFQGDIVATESSPGHDIGVVSLTGELVRLQMKKKNSDLSAEYKKVYRKAKNQDIEKWNQAKELEVPTMYKARTIALKLNLQMKLSDVEYQGDKTKAIFYYTADERVDFRELIKVLADEFKVRIEMKQIGTRQEASRLGGIGSCGRELCCSTWLTDFRSVSTSAARYQQLSLNPMKLAGQCGKLKCCLNYELDTYLDALKDFPENNQKIQTEKGTAFWQKTDIFKRVMYYTFQDDPDNFIAVNVDRVKLLLQMNKDGVKPADLIDKKESVQVTKEPDFENVVGQDSLTRFDRKKKNKKKNPSRNQNQRDSGKMNQAKAPANNSSGKENKTDNSVKKEKRPDHSRKPKGKNATQGGAQNQG